MMPPANINACTLAEGVHTVGQAYNLADAEEIKRVAGVNVTDWTAAGLAPVDWAAAAYPNSTECCNMTPVHPKPHVPPPPLPSFYSAYGRTESSTGSLPRLLCYRQPQCPQPRDSCASFNLPDSPRLSFLLAVYFIQA